MCRCERRTGFCEENADGLTGGKWGDVAALNLSDPGWRRAAVRATPKPQPCLPRLLAEGATGAGGIDRETSHEATAGFYGFPWTGG